MVTIWTDPRGTIRGILNRDLKEGVNALVTAYGFLTGLSMVLLYPPATQSGALLMMGVGALAGLLYIPVAWLMFWIITHLFRWLGDFIYNRKIPRELIRPAVAWSFPPLMIAAFCSTASTLLSGMASERFEILFLLADLAIAGVTTIYALYIGSQTVSEAMDLGSGWNGLVLQLIVGMIIGAAIVAVAFALIATVGIGFFLAT